MNNPRLCSRCGWPLFVKSAHAITRNISGRLMAECFMGPLKGTPGAREEWLSEHSYSSDCIDPADLRHYADDFAGIQPSRMYWIEVEAPPRHCGDTALALDLLMKQVGQTPFRLYAKDGYNFTNGVHVTRYEAWPA